MCILHYLINNKPEVFAAMILVFKTVCFALHVACLLVHLHSDRDISLVLFQSRGGRGLRGGTFYC